MITVVATMGAEDLERYRRVTSRRKALELNPRAYDAETSERIVYESACIDGEMVEKYGADTEEQWRISMSDGTIYYEDS